MTNEQDEKLAVRLFSKFQDSCRQEAAILTPSALFNVSFNIAKMTATAMMGAGADLGDIKELLTESFREMLDEIKEEDLDEENNIIHFNHYQ